MILYFDASALAKRYLQEPETTEVNSLLAGGPAATCRLSEVEIASALIRRSRQGDFPAAERDRALEALRKDLQDLYVVELGSAVVGAAIKLLQRHLLRAADALQLGAAVELRRQLEVPVLFVAYDKILMEAAQQEGLQTLPNPA